MLKLKLKCVECVRMHLIAAIQVEEKHAREDAIQAVKEARYR